MTSWSAQTIEKWMEVSDVLRVLDFLHPGAFYVSAKASLVTKSSRSLFVQRYSRAPKASLLLNLQMGLEW